MRIVILTLGTHGDVLPFVALGAGLQRAGDAVTLATAAPFAGLAQAQGLACAPLSLDYLTLTQSPAAARALRGSPLAILRLLHQTVLPALRRLLDEAWAASQGAEAVVYHPKALAGSHVAERLGVPGFLGALQPGYAATAAFPSALLPVPNLGGPLNRLSYPLLLRLPLLTVQGVVNTWRRRRLGLPPRALWADPVLGGRPATILHAFSPQVVPPPAGWPAHVTTTGYWFLDPDPDWQPPPALEQFLAAGPPPVYVGFGSMPGEDAGRTTQTVLEALRRADQRGLLARGWGGLEPATVPPWALLIDEAPHAWLFPRVAAVVHHGGAGTTAAGVPAVVCPVFGDQPFWGRRLQALGVAPAPIPRRALRVDRLLAGLEQTLEPAARERAAALGVRIRDERGVGRAVEHIRGGAAGT
jgi:sterol 3beta-glucosyltransferase